MPATDDDRLLMITNRVDAAYAGLHVYLKGRYADNLVLTFDQIEDLNGVPLPPSARLQVEWWGSDEPSPQSYAWIAAHRTATVNLFARTVLFQRDNL
jgi:hypothetical protein